MQRRLNSEIWLRLAVAPLWFAVTVVALQRLLVRSHTLPWSLVAFGGAASWWWLRVREHRVAQTAAAVTLDRSAGAGGLLLTRLEVPVGEWELTLNERVRAAPLPEVSRFRHVGLAALSLLFLVIVLLIPLPKRVAPAVNAAASTRVAQVEARAEALAKEVPLEAGVDAELARLREELENAEFDAADWEAADTLDARLAQKAAQAAAALAKAAEAARALEEAVAHAQAGEATRREREALEQALLALDPSADGGAQALEKALAQLGHAPQGGQAPSKTQVGDLQRALKQRQEKLARSYGQGDGASAKQRMAKARRGGRKGQGDGRGDANGHGAPGRGGGSKALKFGEPAEVNPERLDFAPLPEGNGGDDPGELWGLRGVDPKRSAQPSAGPGVGEGVPAQGEQAPGADQAALLPRNRDLIRRYFDSK